MFAKVARYICIAALMALGLAQPAAARFPTGSALAEWAHRASAALAPEMVNVADDAREAFVTPLQPSPSLRVAAAFR